MNDRDIPKEALREAHRASPSGEEAAAEVRPSRASRIAARMRPVAAALTGRSRLLVDVLRCLRVARDAAARWLRAAWTRPAVRLACLIVAVLILLPPAALFHDVYFDRGDLPEIGPFIAFAPPTTGEVLDARGDVLIRLAREYRQIVTYDEIPVVVRHVVRHVAGSTGALLYQAPGAVGEVASRGLALIQEGLRGVVRLPGGTAHSLSGRGFAIPVMGKTGTTSGFRDALFVGSTYGPQGITVAIRIGFDDNRTLGRGETGGRTALPVFREIVERVYGDALVGGAPPFPRDMEDRIDAYLANPPVPEELADAVPEGEAASGFCEVRLGGATVRPREANAYDDIDLLETRTRASLPTQENRCSPQ